MKKPTYIIDRTVIHEPSSEDQIYPAFIQYAKRHYPKAEVFANVVADVRLKDVKFKQYQSLQMKAHSKGMVPSMPDLLVNYPSRGFNLLRIESKKVGVKIFKRDGGLLSDSHIYAQACYLSRLTQIGNLAVFCIGLENHIKLLDWYMNEDHIGPVQLEEYHFNASNGYIPEPGMIYKTNL